MESLIKDLFSQHGDWRTIKKILSEDHSIVITPQQAFDIIHDITNEARIAPCGREKQFRKFTLGYQYCGTVGRCPCARQAALELRTATNLERFGASSPLATQEGRAKRASTMMERHGVEHPMQSGLIAEKARATNIDRYGVDYVVQSVPHREKGARTIATRTDEERENINKARQATNLMRYDVEHAARCLTFKEKTVETNVQRYGVDHPSKLVTNRNAAKTTSLQRYERYHYSQRHIDPSVLTILEDRSALENLMSTKSVGVVAQELGISATTFLRSCSDVGVIIPRSSYEGEIAAFLAPLTETIINDRTQISPLELDFYLPDYRIAIEFNGLYWYSTARQNDNNYHRKKYLACRDRGIRLIMISEDEWVYRGSIIRKKIKNLLGLSVRGCGARKLSITETSASEAKRFIEDHHIQGAPGAIDFAIGATDAHALVGVMAFNQQRGTGAVELIRFCSSGDVHAGLFSRLFRHSIQQQGYKEVVSFADLRYSDGGVYEKNGFQRIGEIKPDYRYVIRDRTFHKRSFTKAEIARKFGIDMAHLTERQAMEQMGFPRIYDCGKIKYVWRQD